MNIYEKVRSLFFKERTFGAIRSYQWRKLRKIFLKGQVCEVCGGKKDLEVHHIEPIHINPEGELEIDNLITLCDNKKNGVRCHLFFGHLGSYHSFNPDVREEAKLWWEKIKNR